MAKFTLLYWLLICVWLLALFVRDFFKYRSHFPSPYKSLCKKGLTVWLVAVAVHYVIYGSLG